MYLTFCLQPEVPNSVKWLSGNLRKLNENEATHGNKVTMTQLTELETMLKCMTGKP
jgi:hypothetical protein